MKLDQLWAPWRLGYVVGEKKPAESKSDAQLSWQTGADQKCFICQAVADMSAAGQRNKLVVTRTDRAIALLNLYPYNNGHLLVAPLAHMPRLESLDSQDHAALMQLCAKLCGIIERQMKAEGFNIGLNVGHVAGASLTGHLHWHVVPRWSGDTNFMPALAGVRVIPQSLEAMLDLLRDGMKH